MRIGIILLLAAASVFGQEAPQAAQRSAELQAKVAQLAALQAELAAAQKTYTDSHPEVRRLKARLEAAKAEMDAAKAAQAASLDARAKQVAARRAQLEASQKGSVAALTARSTLETLLDTRRGPAARSDTWWRNSTTVQQLGVTPAQVKRMDETFQQYRLKLIDLNAGLEKEEVTLEPLVAADTLDEGKITAQIDRVAQARAELEKARGRMLLGIRKVLEPEQWRKLNEMQDRAK